MKHKHSEVIKAFVDGIKCQGWDHAKKIWYDITNISSFDFCDDARIKPKPLIHEEYVIFYNDGRWSSYACQQEVSKDVRQIKTTYQDCILVNAEVIK
jgi:hypothetical protein